MDNTGAVVGSIGEPVPEWVTWRRVYRNAGVSGEQHGWVHNKPLVQAGVCAEIAIRDELADAPGWDAVWVRNAVGLPLRFWRTMPSDLSDRTVGETELPSWPLAVLRKIDPEWQRGGVLDVLAWNEATGEIRFAEAKRRGKDRLRPNQLRFIRQGLANGFPPATFIVVEWDYL